MNLLRIYGATLLVALTMGMSACKNEDAPVTAPAVSAEANSGQKISLNVDIEGLSTSDLRAMEIQENIVGNQHAGLKFVWKTTLLSRGRVAHLLQSQSVRAHSRFSRRRGTAIRLVSMLMPPLVSIPMRTISL